MTTAQEIGEAFEEVVENLKEYEYPYCYLNEGLQCANWEIDPELPW